MAVNELRLKQLVTGGIPYPAAKTIAGDADVAVNTAITAVSGTIRNDASIVTITSNGAYTLTSAPTIADGVDGQRLRIVNLNATNAITIQDQGTLALSNLRLMTTTVAIGPRDSIELTYLADVGDWVQTTALTTVI